MANDIEVRLPSASERPDPEIARDAAAALKYERYRQVNEFGVDDWVSGEHVDSP
jgi:hypothetical protein